MKINKDKKAAVIIDNNTLSCRNLKEIAAAKIIFDSALMSKWSTVSIQGSEAFIQAFELLLESRPDCKMIIARKNVFNPESIKKDLTTEQKNSPKPKPKF